MDKWRTGSPTVARTYQGRSLDDALDRLAAEAIIAGRHGYQPEHQSWAGGRPHPAGLMLVPIGGLLILAGLLFFPLIGAGLVAVVIGLMDRGDGRLTVTFRRMSANGTGASPFVPPDRIQARPSAPTGGPVAGVPS